MKRGLANLITDLLAALGLLAVIATGYILRFPLPPTTNRTHELWGMSRHEWGSIHGWASLGLLLVLCIHLVLHWEWIFSTVRRYFTNAKAAPHQKLLAGLVTVAVLMVLGGGFAWRAHADVRELETPRHAPRQLGEAGGAQTPEQVNFRRDVAPIFEASCMGCHGPKVQRANFRVDRRENFFAPGEPRPLIVPGHAEKSRLIAIVSGKISMRSFEDHRLPPSEIALLKAWINEGADWPEK